MLEPKIYSVSKVNGYIRTLLEKDYVLGSIWVAGEISNFKKHSSGHMYFSMKLTKSFLALKKIVSDHQVSLNAFALTLKS